MSTPLPPSASAAPPSALGTRASAPAVSSSAESIPTGVHGTDVDTRAAAPMLQPNPSHSEDLRADDFSSRQTTTSRQLGQVAGGNTVQRSRHTTATTSESDRTAVLHHQRSSPNDVNMPQTTTMTHSASAATITLFDESSPPHPSSSESQPLTSHKTTTPPGQVGSQTENDLPPIYARLCPYPPAQKLIPRTRARRIACCACLVILVVLISIGIYIAVTLASLVPPKLELLRTSVPLPPRQPVSIDTNGPVVTIQWDLIVSIANPNSIPIELYDIRFAGYPSPTATQVPLVSGNLTTMSLPARISATIPSRSEWLVPITVPWRIRDPGQNGFLINLLTACNAPKALVPNGATVKPGDKVKLWYTADAGVEWLRWFAGGYRHKREAWAEFACPVNLAEVPGLKEIAGVVGTVREVVSGLLPNGAIPDVRLPTLPPVSSVLGQ